MTRSKRFTRCVDVISLVVFIGLLTFVLALGGGGKKKKLGSFEMTYKADGRYGLTTECPAPNQFTANASTTTNRGAKYLAATAQLFEGASLIDRDDKVYDGNGPRSSINARASESRPCIPLNLDVWRSKTWHKAIPMTSDKDYKAGGVTGTDSRKIWG